MASPSEKNLINSTTDGRSTEKIVESKARLLDSYSSEFSTTSQGITQNEKKEETKVCCITRAIAEDFDRKQVLYSSLIQTIFFVLFLGIYYCHVVSIKSTEMFYMNDAIRRVFLNRPFPSIPEDGKWRQSTDIFFQQVTTVTNMWQFISEVFIDTIYSDKYYDESADTDKKGSLEILNENEILGVPRIRQVRVRADSCAVHPYFSRLFRLCFGPFDEDNEDAATFGLGKAPAWTYTSKKYTGNSEIVGKLGTYDGGGYYMDLSSDSEEAADEIRTLRENNWITRNTRAVILDLTIYNVNLNFFGNCKLIFELPPTGGVVPTYKIDSIILKKRPNISNKFNEICENITNTLILFHAILSLRELLYFKLRYFKRFWSYIDWINFALLLTNFILNIRNKNSFAVAIKEIKENPNKFANLDDAFEAKATYDNLSALTLFMVIMWFFKYFNFSKRMGQLNDTLKKCVPEVLGFSVMFFIIFFAYAELGFLLFGNQVETFRSFGHSMFTLLRIILGDFNYQEISDAQRVMAPIFFISYIFVVFFVLLNMFLAIINDSYIDVKTEIAYAPPELQMNDYLKQGFLQFLYQFHLIELHPESEKLQFLWTADEMRKTLEQCGFPYLEIEMFFARFNINPATVVTKYDVSKLVEELESKTPGGTSGEPDSEHVHDIEELMAQKQQLREMKGTMSELSTKIDLLRHLLDELGAKVTVQENDSEEDSSSSSERIAGQY